MPLYFFNRLSTKIFRKNLRTNSTRAEILLWKHICRKQLGVKFRRQHGLGPFIADFYCPEKKLVIEVDGASHATMDAREYDAQRTSYIGKAGISVIRFTNQQVFDSLDEVLNQIRNRISSGDSQEDPL